MPSPGINWSSPAALTLTTALMKLTNRSRAIGHVTVKVNSSFNPSESFHTGMTQLDRNEGKKETLLKGYGFGILFYSFKGKLESAKELDPEVLERCKNGNISFVRFEVNSDVSKRLIKFFKEYQLKGAGNFYGSPHRPRYAEGGGCGPFAESVVELAGLLSEELNRSWIRRVRLPLKLIGGPKTGKKVHFLKMLFHFSWAKKTEPGYDFSICDPDLMHQWVLKKIEDLEKNPDPQYAIEAMGKAKGIVMHAQNQGCPSDPIFKGQPDPSRLLI